MSAHAKSESLRGRRASTASSGRRTTPKSDASRSVTDGFSERARLLKQLGDAGEGATNLELNLDFDKSAHMNRQGTRVATAGRRGSGYVSGKDWMSSAAGTNTEGSCQANKQLAIANALENRKRLRETLAKAQERQEESAKRNMLKKAQDAKRMALMPQVRIRNVTKEYKLAAGLFTPALLVTEERGPYSRKPRPEEENSSPMLGEQ